MLAFKPFGVDPKPGGDGSGLVFFIWTPKEESFEKWLRLLLNDATFCLELHYFTRWHLTTEDLRKFCRPLSGGISADDPWLFRNATTRSSYYFAFAHSIHRTGQLIQKFYFWIESASFGTNKHIKPANRRLFVHRWNSLRIQHPFFIAKRVQDLLRGDGGLHVRNEMGTWTSKFNWVAAICELIDLL